MSLPQQTLERLLAPVRRAFESTVTDSPSVGWSHSGEYDNPGVSETALKSALVLGFGLFTIGVLSAHLSPADGYEVSVYAATPIYWGAIGVTSLVSVVTLLYGYRTKFAYPALLLGGLSVASVLALPVLRNYYFHGYQDPMTHLGQIRALWGGWATFFEVIYPGSYSATVFVGSFAGLPARRAMLYVMFLFGLLYLLFIPLVVRTIVPDRRAVLIAGVSGFLLLPINNVATYYRFHVFTLTALFLPVALYVVLKHLTGGFDDESLPSILGPSVFVFPLVSVAMLWFHPQATADLLVVLGSIVLIQVGLRLFAPGSVYDDHRRVYGQFILLAVLFLFWATTHSEGANALSLLLDNVQEWFAGKESTGQLAQQRASSAENIGVSVYELFLKFFSVDALYIALTGGFVLSFVLGRIEREEGSHIETAGYLILGGVLLVPVTLLHIFGESDAYLFRHIGLGMVLATVLGALAVYYLVRSGDRLLDAASRSWLKPAAAVTVVGILLFSILTIYASPFLYLPGQHVSEYQMEGYETAFEMQDDERTVWFGGIRQSSNRYEDAMFAAPGGEWDTPSPRARSSGPVAAGNITDLREHYETHWEEIVRRDHYFVVSREDYKSELVAYDSLRYNESSIDSIRDQRSTYPVYSNGNYHVYYVDTSGTPLTGDAIEAESES